MPNINILTLLLTITGIALTFFAPIPLSEELKLLVIGIILIIFTSIVLSNFQKEIEEIKKDNEKNKEKLNIHEQLIDIKSELTNIKKWQDKQT